MGIKVIEGRCPVKQWTSLEAKSYIGVICKVEQDPTGKLYREPDQEVYTVTRDGQEYIAAVESRTLREQR